MLPYFNFLINYRHNNRIYKIPVIQGVGREIMWQDFASSWLVDLLKKMHGGKAVTIFDVGVNLGQTMLGIKTLEKKDIKYIGFEPNPVCIYYLENLINYNDFKDCQIIPAALSSKSDILSFIVSSDTDDAGTIVQELRPDKFEKKKQHVSAIKFDDTGFAKNTGDIIVKIDVEGAELDVLKGMQNFIGGNRPPVICEVLHAHSAAQLTFCEKRNNEILAILKSLDYKIFRIIKKGEIPEVAGFEEVFEFDKLVYNGKSGSLCDYLFLPKEAGLPAL
jgi:FkbM family methyltransferase